MKYPLHCYCFTLCPKESKTKMLKSKIKMLKTETKTRTTKCSETHISLPQHPSKQVKKIKEVMQHQGL